VSGCSGDGIVYGVVMTGRAPFDPFTDFAPIGRVMRDHWVVARAILQRPANPTAERTCAKSSAGRSLPRYAAMKWNFAPNK